MPRELWAGEMLAKLGTMPAAQLLQLAQGNAAEAGNSFYATQGEDAPYAQLEDEVRELLEAVREKQPAVNIRNEVGDVLFNLINVCRLHDINFAATTDKVAERWLTRKAAHEQKIQQAGYTWLSIPFDLKEKLWHEVKAELKQSEYQE